MKHVLTACLLLSASVILAAFGESSIARQVRIDRSKPIVLADNGKSNCVIVVEKSATKVAAFAAKELQKFLLRYQHRLYQVW